jgi:hypothetical protein
MKINMEVYQAIMNQKRLMVYSMQNQIWYVVKWTDGVYIHYRIRTFEHSCKFYYYLSGSINPPSFNPQTEVISV